MENSSVNNKEAFYHYADEASVQNDLFESIKTINSFLKTEFIKLPTEFNWNDHDIFNYLHRCFEKLNGKWNSSTALMTVSPQHVKDAIRMINFTVHRLERRPYKINRRLYLSWDKNCYRRQQLTTQEHEYFTNLIKPNTVYLNYVEVGKSLFDLFQDYLDPSYEGYDNLHYVGAEIYLDFEEGEQDIFSSEFKNWAKKFNIDVYDKQLGIGKLPIGTFTGSDELFTKDSKITSIEIEE